MLTTDGEGEKLQKVTLKEVNGLILLGQKPRITLFYTCQAIRLYESRHDAFACKQASSKAICHSSVPLALTRIKKKNPALGRKTELACEYINGNDNGNGNYFVPCHFVLRMVFPLEERGFSFCRITAL